MDLVVRNARLASAPEASPVDIGVKHGRIAAVQPNLDVRAPTYDAKGRLTCAGMVETHIHLEKSRIVDRCAPESGRLPMAMERVSAVKHTFLHSVLMSTLTGEILNLRSVTLFPPVYTNTTLSATPFVAAAPSRCSFSSP